MSVGFEALVFEPRDRGVGAEYFFPNNFGVSVIKTEYSYGGKDGLYEVAVLDRKTGGIRREPTELSSDRSMVTDSIVGWLTPEGVTDFMRKVAALKES